MRSTALSDELPPKKSPPPAGRRLETTQAWTFQVETSRPPLRGADDLGQRRVLRLHF